MLKPYNSFTESVPDPMLAQNINDVTSLPDVIIIQPKIDGVRILCNIKTGELTSRNGNKFNIPHITEAIKNANIRAPVEYIDGELYQHGKYFKEIMSIANSNRIGDTRKSGLRLYVFDCISIKPYAVRYKIIEDICKIPALKGAVELVASFEISKDEIQFYHDQFVKAGFEGSIIRIPGPGYEHKRSASLLKKKDMLDSEFKIVGYEQEKTKDPNRPVMIGAFVMENPLAKKPQDKTFKAKPADTEFVRIKMWQHRDEYIGKLATIQYQSIDPDTGIPRFPIFIQVRVNE